MSLTDLRSPELVWVACLCAEWCGVCREYRERFEQVQARMGSVSFLWIDVEDEADLLHPVDVENFPTVLVAVGDQARFFGTLTPQPQTLERMIRTQLEGSGVAVQSAPVQALTQRIHAKFGGS